jgi:hypothetical protein
MRIVSRPALLDAHSRKFANRIAVVKDLIIADRPAVGTSPILSQPCNQE